MRLAAIENVSTHQHFYPTRECVNIIYKGTGTASPARRMLVDFTTGSGDESWLEYPNLDPRYLLDVCKAFMRKTDAQQTVRDFRDVPMNAIKYKVFEHPPPQNIPGV